MSVYLYRQHNGRPTTCISFKCYVTLLWLLKVESWSMKWLITLVIVCTMHFHWRTGTYYVMAAELKLWPKFSPIYSFTRSCSKSNIASAWKCSKSSTNIAAVGLSLCSFPARTLVCMRILYFHTHLNYLMLRSWYWHHVLCWSVIVNSDGIN